MPEVKAKKSAIRSKKPRKKKETKLKLTAKEKRILLYPPTPETWLCRTNEEWIHINAGSAERCMWCGSEKSETPELMWPSYVSLCEKVGVEPGTLWKQNPDKTILIRKKDESWREMDAVETAPVKAKKVKRKK